MKALVWLFGFYLTVAIIVLLGFEVFKDFEPYVPWVIILALVKLGISFLQNSTLGKNFCVAVIMMQIILLLIIK